MVSGALHTGHASRSSRSLGIMQRFYMVVARVEMLRTQACCVYHVGRELFPGGGLPC